jgi:hypothetical protein
MKFGVENPAQIEKKIINKDLKYSDTIVIGDNSSGKSELLFRLINQLNKSEPVYFIDAVNRNFSVKEISRTEKIPKYNKSILKTRLNADKFNLVDSFNCYGTLTERVEMIYTLFEQQVQELFVELTGKKFELLPGDVLGEVMFPEGRGVLI